MFHYDQPSGPRSASSTGMSVRSLTPLKLEIEAPGRALAAENSSALSTQTDRKIERCQVARRTLTRQGIARGISDRCGGLSRLEAKRLVDSVIEEMTGALVLGQTLKIREFGSFVVREKSARPGRNPRTGAFVPVMARRIVVFRASPELKAAVNGEASDRKVEKRRAGTVRLIDLERRARFGRFDSGDDGAQSFSD